MSAISSSVMGQQFQWATGGGSIAELTSLGSSEWEQAKFMCTDPNGNVYVLSTVGNDPVTANTFHATPYGDNENILLTSYNCSGQLRWAKLIGSTNSDCPSSGIAADSVGNIYVAGIYYASGGTMHIGTDTTMSGAATEYLLNGVIQFDTSGHFHWIRYVGSNTFATFLGTGYSESPITIDGANNVHYFCYMKSGVTLMTGVTSVYGIYDLTYNTAGTLLSAVRLDLDSEFYLHAAVIDPATNKLYAYGEGSTSGGLDTFFAAAFDASRNLLWQYFAGHGDDDGISGIILDQSKHLYFCGDAVPSIGENRFVFNGDSVLAPYEGLSIIMKTDTNGSVGWIDYYGGSLTVNGFNAITSLPNNKIAVCGLFAGNVDCGGTTISVTGGQDPYFVIVDSSGYLQAVQQLYGDGFYNWGQAITSDKVGNIYVGGLVTDSIWAGTPPIPAYHSVGGNSDFFVMKYGVPCSCTSMPVAAYTSTGTGTVNFTYTGTTAGIDSMRWNFGDGGTSTITDPSHIYTAVGTFQACVTVYTDCGHDSFCTDIVVPCFSIPTSAYSHTGVPIVNFTYTGTTSGTDSVVWHFGDGTTGSGLTPSHTYTALGTYTVCATAYTNCDSNIFCDTVVIGTLSASALSISNVHVFPNPANDELYITGILNNTSYRLLNVTGECLQQGVLTYGNNTLSIKTITPGIYILEINNVGGRRDMIRVTKE